ncbi:MULTISPECIES: hypothetical protein [unclassified Pseudomonas]|uniref:hypothetical protein n=1 Tax=unclassified Pseudomonas TaxID=196821 RepID=UPI0020983C1E|nr:MULTISPECIES: hypothetical protein [unclassified Pseudomonas]MCO7518455.1 hypothetical protein [Pseudomonas sp. 1]MCO7542324.1 hypothetical protein [Pseudomonas sp. VA159-2]
MMAGNRRALARLERELVACLTDACTVAQAEIVGFAWLTHRLDLDDFPASLRITWVFTDDTDMARALAGADKARMIALTGQALSEAGIALDPVAWYVRFDSEEACWRDHGGDWNRRLR